MIVFLICVLVMRFSGHLADGYTFAFFGGGLLVALFGFWDDRHDLSPYYRLFAQAIAGLIGVVAIGGVPALDLGFVTIEWGIFGDIVGVVGLVWLINLYNFMDGIDGIAAGEAVTIAGTFGAFYLLQSQLSLSATDWTALSSLVALCFGIAAVCFGFLIWNWSPARIFMGDVGSGFLGYTFGLLALATAQVIPHLLWVWLILLGVFVVDTLFTLLNRVRRHEAWHQAHHSHGYQHAVSIYASHGRVTSAVLLINLVWLAPLAYLAWNNPA